MSDAPDMDGPLTQAELDFIFPPDEVRCPKCLVPENPTANGFCIQCGTKLTKDE